MHDVSTVKDLGIFVDDRLTFNCHMNNIVARASVTANLIMAVLLSRCGHYIFVLLLSSFFPRLISAVADWESTILPHMVWP